MHACIYAHMFRGVCVNIYACVWGVIHVRTLKVRCFRQHACTALHTACTVSCPCTHILRTKAAVNNTETQGKCCQSSSASLCTGLKVILSHCAFVNLSLLPNFAPFSHWVAGPQILMTHNLRNCGRCSWDTGFDSRHWSRAESRGEGKSRHITVSHTLMDSQDHCRKYSGGTLVKH